MPVDRNSMKLVVGDKVKLTKGMSVDGARDGTILAINGEYILVSVFVPKIGEMVQAERYGCEMSKLFTVG